MKDWAGFASKQADAWQRGERAIVLSEIAEARPEVAALIGSAVADRCSAKAVDAFEAAMIDKASQ